MRFAPTRIWVAEAGCLYPFRPEVDPPSDPENDAMRRGKEVHGGIERGIRDNVESIDSPYYPMIEDAILWQEERGPGPRYVEFTIGVNPLTGAAKQFATKNDVPQDWMPVVADLIIQGHTLETWDWKTGNPYGKFPYHHQANAVAFAAAQLFGADEVTTGLAYVSDSGVRPKSWTRDAFDFADDKRKLKAWAQQAPTAEPTPGNHCKYCPAQKVCPAQEGT